MLVSIALTVGSSPRARGALRFQAGHLPGRGIIPACAGSTAIPGWSPSGEGDHPRVRGEHAGNTRNARVCLGSSPRARGAQWAASIADVTDGIIPACAGSTSAWTTSETSSRDHPRVRGEHSRGTVNAIDTTGSSPRARGAHDFGDPDMRRSGIIPACAGSTLRDLRFHVARPRFLTTFKDSDILDYVKL